MRNKGLVALAVIIIVAIVVGEVYVYSFSAENTYRANASVGNGSITYEVGSNIASCYDVVYSDNGDFDCVSDVYIYFDPSYKDNLVKVDQPIGSKELDQPYYVEQLKHQLENRGVKYTVLDAERLSEKLSDDISSGNCRKGLIAVSGALPDTVYRGNDSDRILEWIRGGGCLYWLGSLIGSCYATRDAIVPVAADYESMFLCAPGCLNRSELSTAYSEIDDNGYKNALSLSGNDVKYGVDTSKLATENLAVGFREGGYSSVTLIENGDGMVCVIGGDYSNRQRADLAQIVASHICYRSELLEHVSGNVKGGTSNGTVNAANGKSTMYIYIGGYFTEYGRSYSFL